MCVHVDIGNAVYRLDTRDVSMDYLPVTWLGGSETWRTQASRRMLHPHIRASDPLVLPGRHSLPSCSDGSKRSELQERMLAMRSARGNARREHDEVCLAQLGMNLQNLVCESLSAKAEADTSLF